MMTRTELLTNPVFAAADKFVRNQIDQGLAAEGASTVELSDAAQPCLEAIVESEIIALLLGLAANAQHHHKRTLTDACMQTMAHETS